jgi:hypothetical protein
MKLSMPDRKITAQIIYLFDILSEDLRTWKPVSIHATQSTFYVIARNFGGGVFVEWYPWIMTELRNLWERLMVGRGNTKLEKNDLDFIVNDEELEGYSGRLEGLTKHLWDVERESLRQWQEARSSGF